MNKDRKDEWMPALEGGWGLDEAVSLITIILVSKWDNSDHMIIYHIGHITNLLDQYFDQTLSDFLSEIFPESYKQGAYPNE
jgi:hypothetical protein